MCGLNVQGAQRAIRARQIPPGTTVEVDNWIVCNAAMQMGVVKQIATRCHRNEHYLEKM